MPCRRDFPRQSAGHHNGAPLPPRLSVHPGFAGELIGSLAGEPPQPRRHPNPHTSWGICHAVFIPASGGRNRNKIRQLRVGVEKRIVTVDQRENIWP